MKFEEFRTYRTIALTSMVTVCVGTLVVSNCLAQNLTVPTKEVVLKSEVEWTYLNPARKELAPMAGTLWGDRDGNEPTGYLLKPPKDFQSPPHIHNVSYRGIVISGLLHNDDPDAEFMWMPEGSFWTQPKGQVHITAAKGDAPIAYIEIEKGPYLVLPTKEAFLSQLRPVNVDKSNLVWLDSSDISWVNKSGSPAADNQPQISFLWGDTQDGQLNGTFIKLPAGFNGKINSNSTDFRAIVVKGLPQYQMSETDIKILEPGSYFSSKGASAVHHLSSKTEKETIIYVRTNGKYNVISE